MSPESLRIVNSFKFDAHNRLTIWRQMQLDLIRYHFPAMDAECQSRAVDTIIRLQENMHEEYI